MVIGGGGEDGAGSELGLVDPSTPPPSEPLEWTPYSFIDSVDANACDNGDRYIRFDEGYGLFVGVALCSATRYKIYLGASAEGVFHEIGDYAGHGQDHCELVNAAFTIPDEDDITSGGCTSCQTSAEAGEWYLNPVGSQGYSRANHGQPFSFESVWPEYNLYTVSWYECGVAIP